MFGYGATATLQGAADGVDAAVTDLARNVHGALAGVLTLGKTANDRIHGKESTDAALEHVRLGAQQGVESLEDAFEWIQGLADSLQTCAER